VAVIQPFNTVLSITIVLLGLLGPASSARFSLWIAAGMALALVGDINNVNMTDDRTVMRGLVLFVLAYLTYSVGLTLHNGFHPLDWIAGLVLLAFYGIQMRYLWPGLGAWKAPVMIYGLLMPFLVSRAVSTYFGQVFSATQAALLSLGAICLYLGDLEFGIQRFRRPLGFNFGPLLYGGGQLMVALGTLGL
jgi:uncharacterized membrane protein YhhN